MYGLLSCIPGKFPTTKMSDEEITVGETMPNILEYEICDPRVCSICEQSIIEEMRTWYSHLTGHLTGS